MPALRLEISGEAGVLALRTLSREAASAGGLGPRDQGLVALAVTEVATNALRHATGATAEVAVEGGDTAPLLTVTVTDQGPGIADVEGLLQSSEPDHGLARARRAAGGFSMTSEPGRGTTVTVEWALAVPVTLPAGAQLSGPLGPLETLRREDRALAEVLESLGRAETEVGTRRGEVAELIRELEATNRGLIALHGELERAREAEAHLAAIVRFSDDAMYSMTLERRISSWNPAAERLLGHRAADIVGSPVEILVPETTRDDLDRAIERLRGGEPAARYETWRRRADGSLVEVTVTLSAMCDPEGRLIGYSVLLYDLTRRRRIEEELAAARASQEVFADRDRIARDLHDLAIQRLFAAGMSLQGTQMLAPPPLAERLDRVIDELDATIIEIRSTIFALQHGPQQATSLRARLLEVASHAEHGLGFAPHVVFTGPVDAAVPDQVAEHLLAVVREALSNAARHAGSSAVEVSVAAGDEVVLQVADNGRGLGPNTRRSGLANMAERARRLGGSFSATGEDGRGTRLEWRVPL